MSFVTVPVTDVRMRLNAILATLDRPTFITQHGRVKAVLLDIDAYNDLLDRLDDARDAADPELRQAVADAQAARERGETIPIEDVLRDYGISRRPTPARQEAA